MDKSTLDYAREYVTQGFSVIPLKPKGKRPGIKSWKPYQDRVATDDELVKWFGGGSDNNIGIVTGSISGLAVVDLDSEEAITFSQANSFPHAPTVQTGKGLHLYYRYQDGIRNFQKRDDLPGIDLRGDGGYVVAPPSIHPSSSQYHWIDGKGSTDIPLAVLPSLVLAKAPADKTPMKELLRGGVSKGSRNDSLARLSGFWAGDGLPLQDCLARAHSWNQLNKPPLPDPEIIRTVEGIYNRHHANAFGNLTPGLICEADGFPNSIYRLEHPLRVSLRARLLPQHCQTQTV